MLFLGLPLGELGEASCWQPRHTSIVLLFCPGCVLSPLEQLLLPIPPSTSSSDSTVKETWTLGEPSLLLPPEVERPWKSSAATDLKVARPLSSWLTSARGDGVGDGVRNG